MPPVNLKKIILKGEVLSLLRGLVTPTTYPMTIEDHAGKILVDDLGIINNDQGEQIKPDITNSKILKTPILLGEETLGWVIGIEQVEQVANFLSYLADREFERKTLAADALDKYREISLLYTISGKMSNCLDVKEISTLVIEEASKLISSTSASVMLHNESTNCLEIISAKGTAETIKHLNFLANQGIAGHVFNTGKPELVNDVTQDPRYMANENECYALICVPILTKDKTLGVVNISNAAQINYTSQDLKLFTALVTQASGAIENAILHESKLREERIE